MILWAYLPRLVISCLSKCKPGGEAQISIHGFRIFQISHRQTEYRYVFFIELLRLILQTFFKYEDLVLVFGRWIIDFWYGKYYFAQMNRTKRHSITCSFHRRVAENTHAVFFEWIFFCELFSSNGFLSCEKIFRNFQSWIFFSNSVGYHQSLFSIRSKKQIQNL